jgi:hypothetical protein
MRTYVCTHVCTYMHPFEQTNEQTNKQTHININTSDTHAQDQTLQVSKVIRRGIWEASLIEERYDGHLRGTWQAYISLS